MLKMFFKDSLIYTVSNILSRGVNLLLIPFYTRVLTPSDYGLIDIVIVMMAILNTLLTLEISQGIARFYCDAKSKNEKQQYASTTLWYTLFIYSIFAIFAYMIPINIMQFLLSEQINKLIIITMIACIWSNGFLYLVQNQLRWSLKSKECAIVSLACTLISVLTTIISVLWLNLNIIGVLLGLTVGNVCSGLLGVYYSRDTYRFIFSVEKFKILISFSFPLVPSVLGIVIALYIDRLLIKALLSLQEVGLYGIGYRFASIASLCMVGIQGALIPLVYTYYKEKDTPLEIARIFRYFITGALLFFLGITLFSREILMLFTTAQYYEATGVIPLLVLAVLLSGMYIFAPGLGIAKKTKVIASLNICSAVVNTLLNWMVIPFWGIVGSAFATLLTALLTFIISQHYSQKLYYIPYEWDKICRSCIFTIVLASIGITFLANVSLMNIFIKVLLLILDSLFVIKLLITYNEFSRIILNLRHFITLKLKGVR